LAAVVVLGTPARHVGAAPADHLTITTTVVSMRSGTMFNLRVVAHDASGAIDTTFNGTISINASATGGSNFPGGTFSLAASSGAVNVFGLRLDDAADDYRLSASSPGLADGVSNSFAIQASRLVVTNGVSTMQAGTPFGLGVQARDSNNAIAENFNGNIALNADARGGSNFVGGSQVLPAAAGSVSFGGLALNNAANNYSITASASGVAAGFSNAFNVTATHLTLTPVADARAGDPFVVTAEARDADDMLAENFTNSVSLNAAATGGSNFTSGTASLPSVAGSAKFLSLTLNDAADGYALTAAATGLTPGVSNTFRVTARQLLIMGAVANRPAGTPFAVQVEARDGNNALSENFSGSISLDAVAIGGSNFNGGTAHANANAGVASFGTLALNDAADAYTIGAGAAGVINATSNTFNITASHLTSPAVGDVRAGDPFSASVEAHDANDNIAENFVGNVSLDAAAAGGSNFIGGTAVSSAIAGAATIGNLTLTNAADGYTVTAGTAGLVDAVSGSFDVTARQLVITTTVADVEAGTPFAVQVEARDADNVTAENFAATVALDAAAAGGANFTGGTQGATAGGGAATFPSLMLETPADAYTVTASSSGVLSAVSNTFNVAVGRPDVSIDDLSVAEGNSGTRDATFTVSLSQPAPRVVTVGYTVVGASATSGHDFLSGAGTLTFAPGVTAQSISVAVIGDLLNESDETFAVNLADSANANIVDGQGVGTIRNDDPIPSISVQPGLAVEGSAQRLTATLTVRLSAVSGQQVSVAFRTADGTATDGVGESNFDYAPIAGTVVFAPGEQERTITISLRNDLVVEADELVFVDLTTAVNATITTPRTTVVILDDDAPVRQLAALGVQVLALDLDVIRTANLLLDLRLNCGGMHQFTRDVARYRGAYISAADANALTAAANRLAVDIRCPI
jgi:hypothetical protein